MADWTQQEDELIIADYFQMLNAELKGLAYNKTEHRNRLLKILKGRTEGAIEKKHQNISAVLIKYGIPYINGYKPLSGFQRLLEEEILLVLNRQKGIEKVFNDFATKPFIENVKSIDFSKWEVKPPKPLFEKKEKYKTFRPVKKNYLEIEQNNRSVGNRGEQMAFDYEVWKLRSANLPKLAEQVEWISRDKGDGAGFDILSKSKNGKDKYIEVKSTKSGSLSPIFFSKTEYDFSKLKSDSFFLYRVFNIQENPQIFTRPGSLEDICRFIEATNYKGYF